MRSPVHCVLVALIIVGFGSAQAANDTYPHGKLPSGVTPVSYKLTLNIDPRKPEFSGVADVAVKLDKAQRSIWLHGHTLKVSKATILAAGKTIPARYTEVDTRAGVARLETNADIPAGAATLHFEYTGPVGEAAEGLYRLQNNKDCTLWQDGVVVQHTSCGAQGVRQGISRRVAVSSR